ncbi:hypothetical protein [Nitrosomonas sp. Nm166]|uniref:hypothetical protein n=1 Tax=Nitrosomonas sp. Nm166 TaxID=1881054 RepID=UPI000B833FE2|nr:hypothetical protein [Nitrosomonas sp. Nm166]
MLTIRNFSILLIACLLTACVHILSGPSVMTLPGSGKSFEVAQSAPCSIWHPKQPAGLTQTVEKKMCHWNISI